MYSRILIAITILCGTTAARGQYRDNTPSWGAVRPPGLVHILDIKLSGTRAYAGGTGGLWVIDMSDKSRPVLESAYRPRRQRRGRSGIVQIYGLAVNGNTLYCCERTNGVEIMDVGNSGSPTSVGQRYRRDTHHSYEGALIVGAYLYLAVHEHGVEVVDISTPRQLRHVSETETTNAFALARVQDHLFVADGAGGLSVLDISNPAEPHLLHTSPTTGLAIDVAVEGSYAYVAVGSSGMDVFDIRNPATPLFVTNYHVDGFTNRLTIANGRAYLANWETVEVVDLSTPSQPHLVATQHAFERAMAIAAAGNTFYVGDWASFRIYGYEKVAAPDVNTDPLEISFGTVPVGSAQQLSVQIENLGQEPLSITDISAVGNGFSVASISFTLNPFESREVQIAYQPTATGRTAGFVNIRSNDPDEPEKIVPLTGGERTIGIGDTPPDFTLQDIGGQSVHLQDLIDQGKVVVLALFASW